MISHTDTSNVYVVFCSITSSFPIGYAFCIQFNLFTIDRCSIITPLGRPVVPEVYIIYARFLSFISALGFASSVLSSPFGNSIISTLYPFASSGYWATSILAPLLSSIYSILSLGYLLSIGIYAAPAFIIPYMPTIISIHLSVIIPTISSAFTPFDISSLANLLARLFSSLYVIDSPPKDTAILSGVFSTCASNRSTNVFPSGYSALVLLNSFINFDSSVADK